MRYLLCTVALLIGIAIAIVVHQSHISNLKKDPAAFTKVVQNDTNTTATAPLPPYYKRATDLFLHNLFVAFLLLIGGSITAGSLSIIVLIYNGFLATSTIATVYYDKGAAFIFSHLWHAPFEITALILFGGQGLLGYQLFKRFLHNKPWQLAALYSVKTIVFSTLLLFIAALIEAY